METIDASVAAFAALARGDAAALERDPDLLGAFACDGRGVPFVGRSVEYAMLRAAGDRDASLGRLVEGHANALQLVARFGTTAQRARANADARSGRLFGVWNTQAHDGVRIVRDGGAELVLTGRKTFGSGAGRVARAIVTAASDAAAPRMLLVPMDRVATAIDRESWRPLGMHDSGSFAVDFDGVALAADDEVGAPGEYERAPWFTGGASRFLAVHTGALARVAREAASFLVRQGRAADPLQRMRLGENEVAVRTAALHVEACVRAWERFDLVDADESSGRDAEVVATALLATVDCARVAVEDAALATLERVERSVGARGLLEPEPFARLVRDLRMYLRQPAPDAARLRAGEVAIADATSAAAAASSAAVATST